MKQNDSILPSTVSADRGAAASKSWAAHLRGVEQRASAPKVTVIGSVAFERIKLDILQYLRDIGREVPRNTALHYLGDDT